jgi:protein TonB
MADWPHSGSSWKVRSIALVGVVLLHVGLTLAAFTARSEPPTAPIREVDVVIVDLEPPAPEIAVVNSPEMLAPALPNMAAPEISIAEPEISAAAENLPPAELMPTAFNAGQDPPTAGGNSGDGWRTTGGGGGDGNGTGASAFTKCTNRVKPKYPIDSKVRREEGRVILLVVLDETGTIVDAQVGVSSGSTFLDNAFIEAVKQWKCSPVYHQGRPVRVRVKQGWDFRLQ